MYIIDIINTIVIPIAFGFTFFSLFVLIPIGIILGIDARKITDSQKRNSRYLLCVLIGATPFILLFLLISLWGLMNIVVGTFSYK